MKVTSNINAPRLGPRLGPNPWVVGYLRHIPRIGGWAVSLGVFFAWPLIFSEPNKRGWYAV